ncbi:MAG: hypothetical protein DDT37_01868 [Firmicutes bacterium]|nr:hypothetical protein [candidate division NPL-UPA2 bacterium]
MGEKTIAVPDWGGSVIVRGMSKREQQQLRKAALDPLTGQIDTDKMEILMLVHCLASPKITMEQAEQLAQKSAAAFDKVLTAIMDVTGLSEEVQKQTLKSFHTRLPGSETES